MAQLHQYALPFLIAGTSSPSANSRIMVPETGDVLSSSKANFLEAFLLGVPLLQLTLTFLAEAKDEVLLLGVPICLFKGDEADRL